MSLSITKGQWFFIGLSGRQQSGKDTVARMIIAWLTRNGQFDTIQTRAFAGPLKRILQYLRPSIQLEDMETEKGKNTALPPRGEQDVFDVIKLVEAAAGYSTSEIDMMVCLTELMDLKEPSVLIQRITPAVKLFEDMVDQGTIVTVGQALQKLGTDCFRETVGSNVWIAFQKLILLIQQKKNGSVYGDDGDKHMVIFTDMRFPNEYDFICGAKGAVVRILRNVDYSKSSRDRNHPSETALDNHYFPYKIDNRGSLEETEKQINEFCHYLYSNKSEWCYIHRVTPYWRTLEFIYI